MDPRVVRFLVAAPPKTGNVWLEKLFSVAFGLQWLRSAPPYDYWGQRSTEGLRAFIESGEFPRQAICHQHFWPSPELFGISRDHDVGIITTLRDPYDQFVSFYFYIQNFPDGFRNVNDPDRCPVEKPIVHPVVLDLLVNEFAAFLDQGIAWLESGRSFVVRYEELHSNPHAVLIDAQCRFGLDFVTSIQDTIASAHRDVMRQQGPDLMRHIHAGRTGTSYEHLSQEHLDIFRTHHATRLERLGYAVR